MAKLQYDYLAWGLVGGEMAIGLHCDDGNILTKGGSGRVMVYAVF